MGEIRDRSFPVFTTPPLLAELAGVLTRKKLTAAVNASGSTAEELMLRYRRLAIVVQPTTIPPAVPTDPDDDNVLACAVSAKANLIVSGDSDLLTLKAFREIPIVSAIDAVKVLETGTSPNI